MKEDKKNYRNWKNGDTFALKVHNENKHGIKYLILNLVVFDFFKEEQPKNHILFRVKILKNDNLPISGKDVENLEYLKTMLFSKHNAYESSYNKPDYVQFIPDKYGFIYTYMVCLHTNNRKNKAPEDLIYLGNYKITAPVDEYIPWSFHCIPYMFWEHFEEFSIVKYSLLNKFEHYLYKENNAIEYHNQQLAVRLDAERLLNDIRNNPEKYSYLCDDIKDDTLTYVGNDLDKK